MMKINLLATQKSQSQQLLPVASQS